MIYCQTCGSNDAVYSRTLSQYICARCMDEKLAATEKELRAKADTAKRLRSKIRALQQQPTLFGG